MISLHRNHCTSTMHKDSQGQFANFKEYQVENNRKRSCLLISVYPFIRAWFNFHHILPTLGNFRVHPMSANPDQEQQVDTIRQDGTQSQLNLERSKSRMGTFVDSGTATEALPEDGPSTDVPDILARRKFKQTLSDPDLP
ncbi:kinocilin isoform X2 [Denticeps clupeoides]|uniref:kinocilin isoform X2 n=1 Tax=Denticeps clupeoides TaxID=299321 RepID=UPI0010A53648|nr:kinocilin isoform X2 [Denticeps clupeoides]